METLATTDDLEARLGRSLTDSEMTRAQSLLEDASAAARAYAGQDFEQAETTDRLPVRRGKVRLPQRPVNDVSAVEDVDGVAVTHEWDHGDAIDLTIYPLNAWELEPRRTCFKWVDVTYDHGYETIPADVVAVVCQMALRAMGQAPDQAGIQQETLGSYSYSIGAAAAQGAVGMMNDERAVLDRYRRVGGSITVG